MQAAILKSSNRVLLFSVSRRAFSSYTLTHTMSPTRNKQLQVMATPEWPVPYYQRLYRDPPKYDDLDTNLENQCVEPSDEDVIHAKEALRAQGKGYIVEGVEHHFPLKDFVTKFEDSGEFCKAYVDDLL